MYKLFLQDSPNDCGPACLATILNGYGRYVTPVDLSCDIELTRGGATNEAVQKLAASHGLESRMIRLAPVQFHRLQSPAIAFVSIPGEDITHMVVVFRVKDQRILVGDPGKGKSWIDFESFARVYKGFMIIFRPTEEFEAIRISETYLSRFSRFIATWKSAILKSLLLGVLASVVTFGAVYFSKFFVDRVVVEAQIPLLVGFVLVFIVARLFNVFIKGFNEMFTIDIRNQIHAKLSDSFFHHTVDLEKRHIDHRECTDFLQRFANIENLTQGVTTFFSGFFLICFGMLVKMGLLIWFYDPVLVTMIFSVVVINTLVGFLFARSTSEQTNRQGLLITRINTMLLSSLQDIRVIRTFRARNWLGRSYNQLLRESLGISRKLTSLRVYGQSLTMICNALGEATIFLVCGYRIIQGTYTLGDFLVFLTFAQSLSSESLAFPELIQSFQGYMRAFARQQAIEHLDTEQSGDQMPGDEPLEITFENVSFGYNEKVPVLQDVSFRLKAGSTTAIVGESGSGKTTIINLLMGFYKPDSGRILINGIDISDINLDAYRDRLSAVFQTTPIFDKNIYHNITMGNPEINRKQIDEVAKILGINSFIEKMPQGYDYLIYPGVLSGGQTQRIGILRALSKSFDLLVLDEATSQLDSLTENQIVRGIDTLSEGKSRVIIAHRLSTVINAEQILVLKDGRLVESGKHQELFTSKGYYHSLVKRQYELRTSPETREVPAA